MKKPLSLLIVMVLISIFAASSAFAGKQKPGEFSTFNSAEAKSGNIPLPQTLVSSFDDLVIVCDFPKSEEQYLKRKELVKWLTTEYAKLTKLEKEERPAFQPIFNYNIMYVVVEYGEACLLTYVSHDKELDKKCLELLKEFDQKWIALGKGVTIEGKVVAYNAKDESNHHAFSITPPE